MSSHPVLFLERWEGQQQGQEACERGQCRVSTTAQKKEARWGGTSCHQECAGEDEGAEAGEDGEASSSGKHSCETSSERHVKEWGTERRESRAWR